MPGPRRGNQPMEKPKNAFSTVKRLAGYMTEHIFFIILVLIAIIFSALANVIGTSFLRTIIDQYLEPMVQNYTPELMAGFIATLVKMGVIYLVGALCTYLSSRMMLFVSTWTLYKIRVDMFSHMEKLPIRYFDTHTHGDLMSRYTNDIDTLRELLSNSMTTLMSSTVTIVSVLTMMINYSWQLTLLLVLLIAAMLTVIRFFGSRSGRLFRKQQAALGTVNGFIEEMMDGTKVVKVFCHEDKAVEDFEKLNDELCDAATQANTYANSMMPIMANLSNIHYAITAVVGSLLAIANVISLGTVVAFLQYVRNFSQPVSQISQQVNSILNALAGAERVFNLIDETPEVNDGYVTLVNARKDADGELTECSERTGLWAWKHPHQDGSITYTELQGRVEFDNVVFGYVPEKTVLQGISLYAKPGQKIAFVGSTGAGKTTITNLINRFYDVPDGKIRYDGININKINKNDLRRSLSMVLQDTHLFTGTVADNIRYGRLDATDTEIRNAAKLANADFFISHLPQGYDTMLYNDGANLSQGQRQLIAIARAAVADPPVLILDEATSSIDTRTEALIEKGMDSLMEGRTTFVIAHRLSTVRNSDAIMVLEHGKIIERGDHDTLIAQKGRYYQLYTGMFELS
mgnify:FL=1